MMVKLQRKVGRVIRRLRAKLGISQEAFAVKVGVHRTYMGSIERGDANLTLVSLERLARALSISPSTLLLEAESEVQRAGRSGDTSAVHAGPRAKR